MARTSGEQGEEDWPGDETGAGIDLQNAVPELIRRLAALGLSGFFTTESALRRALGDTVPQEWVDFAADQSDRTRREFIERISGEFGRLLQDVDLVELMHQFLAGRTIEVNARIRIRDEDETPSKRKGAGSGGPSVDFEFHSD